MSEHKTSHFVQNRLLFRNAPCKSVHSGQSVSSLPGTRANPHAPIEHSRPLRANPSPLRLVPAPGRLLPADLALHRILRCGIVAHGSETWVLAQSTTAHCGGCCP